MKLLVSAMLCTTCLAAPALAQSPPSADVTAQDDLIIVTGSRIKRSVIDSPVPLSIFTTDDLRRESINSPEQFISLLTSNGNGLDNLASNADVVSGAQRGNNGASSANLRGQGSAATLVLLNGRRMPAHGLNGGVVDINQVPLFAVQRVEVLKDGASAIYGTDAVGGVINFITDTSFEGVNAQGFLDVTGGGGGNIYRGSVLAGVGNLEKDRINLVVGMSISDHRVLRGEQRDFVNTFQPNRGLSPDTRGTPFGTIFPLGVGPNTPNGTVINAAGTAPFLPGSTTVRASGGINPLDLPGNLGCDAIDGMAPYADDLWSVPSARFACAWDTGRAAILQQPIKTISWYGRATLAPADDHIVFAEFTGSKADSAKRFSNIQIIPNATANNTAYPRTAANAAVYDRVFNQLVAVFPTLEDRRGLPIAYRWRCIECGPREIETTSKTFRFTLGAEGPIASGWDYRVAGSYGESEVSSQLGTGYYYRGTSANGTVIGPGLIPALNTGIINPFLLPGETQSAEALALLESASAAGVRLYGGVFGLWQIDASVSGPLFELPGGAVQVALGVDWRRESYTFQGDTRPPEQRTNFILGAPFDDGNALPGAKRIVKAAYGEVLVPLFEGFELTGALRIDDYTGFGSTTNPKISAKYRPVQQVMFRGSYNTSFRVPSFNQIFNGVLESQYLGADIADPATCPGGRASAAPGCTAIQPDILTGGRLDLGPETAKQFSLGVVVEPVDRWFLSLDWWRIEREGTVRILDLLTEIMPNAAIFPELFIRDGGGTLVAIDRRWTNSGGTRTEGLEVSGRGGWDLWNGQWTVGLDGTYLLSKRSKVIEGQPFGPSEVGRFSFSGDLGLRWKHNLFLTYAREDWSVSVSQIFRQGYQNFQLPGVASGAVNPPDVVDRTRDYVIYNLSATYRPFERIEVTAGVKNLFDRDPPFAINYDSNFGSGSSWEPRVADPRGRAFTLLVNFRI